MTMNKINSPYIAITGCTFLYFEYRRLLPILMEQNSEQLLKDEIENNKVLQVNSRTSRQRFVVEFKRRYISVPALFWNEWTNWSEQGQRAGLFYAILRTYKLVFDFHFNVTVKKWNSVERQVVKEDLLMEFNEISAHDGFVDSWSQKTKGKCCSNYLTILRQAGLLDEKTNALIPIKLDDSEVSYYIRNGEEWFLEACLLYPYEVKDIKSRLR